MEINQVLPEFITFVSGQIFHHLPVFTCANVYLFPSLNPQMQEPTGIFSMILDHECLRYVSNVGIYAATEAPLKSALSN